MNDLSTRTSQVIAAEINGIKDQTRKVALLASIEIGRRLVEAKAILEHGQWGVWLKDSVDYSQSTAQNLMRIYQEFGSDQMALYDGGDSQSLGNLSYTQAVALLGVPAEERAAFVEEHDVKNMSSRELQKAIKDIADLKKELALAKKENTKLSEAEADAREAYAKEKLENQNRVNSLKIQLEQAKIKSSTVDVKKLEDQLKKAEQELSELSHKNLELKQELKKPLEPAIVEVVPDEIKRELKELRDKLTQDDGTLVLKFKIYFESLTADFSKLLSALNDIKRLEPHRHEKYAGAVTNLIRAMEAKMKAQRNDPE